MSVRTYPAYKESGVDWIGRIPEDWQVKPLKRAATLQTERAGGRTFAVALENIESWSGRLLTGEGTYEGEGLAFEAGDILFGKLRPYLAKAWIADRAGEAVGDFHVLRYTPGHLPEFLQRVLLSREMISQIDGSTYGAKMPRASWDFMGSLPVPVPPATDQAAIAAFLDRETGKIDALVAEQERLMALLKEKRQAVISQAVTKGLNPDAPMRPSGVEWPTEVPCHWEVLPLTRVVDQFVDYRGATPNKVDEGIPLITATQIKEGKIDHSLDPVFITHEEYGSRMTRGFPAIGDVLLTTEAPLGEVAQIEEPLVAPGQRMVLMKVALDKVRQRYLWLHFRSDFGRHQLLMRGTGSTASGIRSDRLRASVVLVPPVKEQDEILTYVDEELKRFGGLDDEAERAITVLNETPLGPHLGSSDRQDRRARPRTLGPSSRMIHPHQAL